MEKIIVDVQTNIKTVVPLTPEEIVELNLLQAEMAALEKKDKPTLEQLWSQLKTIELQIQNLQSGEQ